LPQVARERERERGRERASYAAARRNPPPAFVPGEREREKERERKWEGEREREGGREKKRAVSPSAFLRIGCFSSSRASSDRGPASFFNFATVHVARAARGVSGERQIDR